MSYAPFPESHVNLCSDRIPLADGQRQQRAAAEILRRFARQPGVVLADEVGMGKTFVALAVAAAVILDDPAAGPVVVMVPPTLKSKWPKDWDVFRQRCLSGSPRDWMRHSSADSGVEFLKLLDDPPQTRAHLIFLTHGALHRALTDGFAKLAVIRRAFKGRSSLAKQRRNFSKFAGRLLRMDAYERKAPGLLGMLLEQPCERWKATILREIPALGKSERDPQSPERQASFDDPVPQAMQAALEDMDSKNLEPLVEVLRTLPQKESKLIDQHLTDIRRELAEVMPAIWNLALRKAHFSSPLIILDEAHHLKNPATRLASLFVDPDAAEESSLLTGTLGGKFERMLFLTATPFQLGHAELIRVLERFDGIHWKGRRKPEISRAAFAQHIQDLRQSLDACQVAALRLEQSWDRLAGEHADEPPDIDAWWREIQSEGAEGPHATLRLRVETTHSAMRLAEEQLRPWVLRHLKSSGLATAPELPRRRLLSGAAITDDQPCSNGLTIDDSALLPFLLAGRAQMLCLQSPQGRALFADGLASSFEAYRETRRGDHDTDEHDVGAVGKAPPADSDELLWYLEQLDKALPTGDDAALYSHPKVRATVEKALQFWHAGEKVLIFCHYRATGRALRNHISRRLHEEIIQDGCRQLPGLSQAEVIDELERIGERLFDEKGLLRRELDKALHEVVDRASSFDDPTRSEIVGIVRRFIRTPSFLVRYFDLQSSNQANAFAAALERSDVGGIALRRRIVEFCEFLAERVPAERDEYLHALRTIQPGTHRGQDIGPGETSSDDRRQLLPNVRLANGETADETRRRLLLAFNTPMFPEILVASSVLAEGVDLHLHCRHVIHHDLCWNPSTLEQRTGRVDRLGSKAERVPASIQIYLPYVAATQDEKMYRVVRDRDRWFQIVLGETYAADESALQREAKRWPLPSEVQAALALQLHIPEHPG